MAEPLTTTPPSAAPDDISNREGIDPFASTSVPSDNSALLEQAPGRGAESVPQGATPPVQAEKPAPVEPPTPEKPVEGSKWTLDSLLEQIGRRDLKPGDKGFEDWKVQKENFRKVVEVNESLAVKAATLESTYQTEKARLETELAEARKTGTKGDVAGAQAEIAALKSAHEAELKDYREWKAKDSLQQNEAFRREFDGKRAELFSTAKETATEIGLDPAKLDAVFEAKSELQLRKAITALEIDDADAEKLITEKALSYAKITQQKDALLAGKTGKTAAELAAEWEGHQAQFSGALSKQLTTTLQGKLLQSAQEAPSRLAEKSSLFKTDHGTVVLQEITERFRQGYDLTENEVIDALALARVAPVWEKQAMAVAAENAILKQQVAAMSSKLPGSDGFRPSSDQTSVTPARQAAYDPFSTREGIDPFSAAVGAR